jgi:hypothetical protein
MAYQRVQACKRREGEDFDASVTTAKTFSLHKPPSGWPTERFDIRESLPVAKAQTICEDASTNSPAGENTYQSNPDNKVADPQR